MFGIKKIWRYLTLADYEEAKKENTKRVIAQISSRPGGDKNASLCQGRYMTQEDLDELREKGDAAVERIAKKVEGRNGPR